MIREKYFIICKPDLASLNKQNELSSSCRHAGKFFCSFFKLFFFSYSFSYSFSCHAIYTLFFEKGGVFIGNCSASISNSMLTVIHIRSFHLLSATHQLCCTKLNSWKWPVKYIVDLFRMYYALVYYWAICKKFCKYQLVHIYLYNNPSYSRILIGSRLWSIRGQTHRWRQRSIQVCFEFF